ncbi:MAG: hypothetical protein V3U79_00865 [Dehalococcoidia bacterium]
MRTEGLRKAITRFGRSKRAREAQAVGLLPESTFDAVLDLRLKELQHQIREVKGRINGLFFFVLGAAILQVGLGALS